MTVLLIGATGMLGRPVARRLAADGVAARALARDPRRAAGVLPRSVEVVEGDVLDERSLRSAMDGCRAVYVNLATPRSARRPDVEARAVPLIIDAARATGVEHLLKISFMGVEATADRWWQSQRKADQQRAIAAAGIDYTVFQPTWFMESLVLFKAGGRLVLPNVPNEPVHWIAGDDYARQVAAALAGPAARNRIYVVQGPEPLSFHQAAARLAAAWQPRPLKVRRIPMWILRATAPLVSDARYLLDLLDVTFRTNARFEAQTAWDDLGEPRMTIEDYARSIRETGDLPRK